MAADRKATLLNRLLDATKECQTQYSVKGQIMTERSSCVSCVCRQFEEVLSHGLKRKQVSSSIYTIQNVTGLQLLDQQDQEPAFWYLIQKHLSKHELDRFMNLYHITSNVGRGRAWLRSALNEHSLERTLQMVLGDTATLESHYLPEAFLLDKEKSSLLPQIAGGLRSIMFSIKIDDIALNNSVQIIAGKSERTLNPSSVLSLPSVSSILGAEVGMDEFPEAAVQSYSSSPSQEPKKEKKKKKKKIISFSHSGEQLTEVIKERRSTSNRTFSGSSDSQKNDKRLEKDDKAYNTAQDDSKVSGQFKMELEEKEYCGNETPPSSVETSSYANDFVPDVEDSIYSSSLASSNMQYGHSSKAENINYTNDEPSGSPSLGFASGFEENRDLEINGSGTIESSDDEGSIDIAKNFDSTLVLRLDTGSEISSPGNSSSTSNETNATAYPGVEYDQPKSTLLDFNYQSAMKPIGSLSLDASIDSSGASMSFTNFSSEDVDNQQGNNDLQKALVVLLQRKDELVDETKVLNELLDTERARSSELLEENENLIKQLEEFKQTNSIDSKRQLQENEVLKSQLKRYVGAVQALQQGKVSGEPILNEEASADVADDPQTSTGESAEKVYERKLIEVTEMHGELMEFTETLHTRFLSALALIHKMHDELVSLRGPLPTDNVIKAIELDKQKLNVSSLASLPRALVNVWVPSAFMQGSGPESHHVYQIYTCLGEDEWNVYRRYSDFYALHNSLSKSFPEVKQFGFPRKKGIGNRNSKIVEERRKAFQAYLRLVMHTVIQKNSRLAADPTKKTLILILPFFSDNGSQCRVIVGKHK